VGAIHLPNSYRENSSSPSPLPYLLNCISSLVSPQDWAQQWIPAVIVWIALWILVSGIDDLFVDTICLLTGLSRRTLHDSDQQAEERISVLNAPQKRIAIFVPLWREEAVIEQMVTNNVSRIQYESYDFFLGAYPNDNATLSAVRMLDSRFVNVHLAVCAHPGPTSKADCLNWIYQRMLAHEREHGIRFEVVVTHDAEDVIHPEAMHWINYYADIYDMIQVPVLPLRTSLSQWTHGIYCDEFAEFQLKDMPGRQILSGFIPSNGVGTGFTRWGMERLAADSGRIFQPECLTEDYENGLRLHFLGCPQVFMPVRMTNNEPMATREYFPSSRRAAIRQRTRWVTGIALQSWERHGWRGGFGTRYWMWRDRKGLIGNPVSMFTSLLFVYGAATWVWSYLTSTPWAMGKVGETTSTLWLMGSTTAIQLVHIGVRAWCTSRVYGWGFAAGVPLRAIYANYINFCATCGAIWRYGRSRVLGEPLVWLKTDHSYPTVAIQTQRRKLGEILVSSGSISQAQLDWALQTKPDEVRLGEHLVQSGMLDEEQVYRALSVQESIPFFRLDPRRVRRSVARSLPAQLIQSARVLPFRVSGGFLFLAAAEVPDEHLQEELGKFTRLQLRLQLVTGKNFEELMGELL
jgi:adsorption protein B